MKSVCGIKSSTDVFSVLFYTKNFIITEVNKCRLFQSNLLKANFTTKILEEGGSCNCMNGN
jgi:hypothetical protein